jgi:tetratricopeptide (TPR) repeat protein
MIRTVATIRKVCIRLVLLVALTGLLERSGTALCAQDVVEVRSEKTGNILKRKGEIRSWEGSSLTLEANGRTDSIPNDTIVRIQTTWSADCLSGRQLLESRQFAAAIEPLAKAAGAETRPWAAAMIRADLVRSLSAIGNDFDAFQQFLLILSQDPETRWMEFAPLAWEGGLVDAPMAALAQKCLESKQPNLQLLGASWLLGTPQRAAAVEVLKKLKQDIRPEVAHLASAQLWRTELPQTSDKGVEGWARQVDRMPESLRAGPLLLVGLASQRLKQTDRAALSWMEIAILHGDNYRLAAIGLSRSAGLLAEQGKTEAARRIWIELSQRFAGTQWATEAESRLGKE